MFCFPDLSYISKIICIKLINQYYNDPLVDYFRIKKTQELVSQKYYKPIFHFNVKAYIKGCDISLALKIVKHKFYNELQLPLVPTY